MVLCFFLFLSACSAPTEEIPLVVDLSEKVLSLAQEFEKEGTVIFFDLSYFSKNQRVTEKGLSYKAFPLSISLQKKINSPLFLEVNDLLAFAGGVYPYDLEKNQIQKKGQRSLVLDFEMGWLAKELWIFVDSPLLEGVNYPKLKALYQKNLSDAPVRSPLFFDTDRFRKDLSENALNSRSLKLKEGGFWESDLDLEEEAGWFFCDFQIQLKDLKQKSKKGGTRYLFPPGYSIFVDPKRGQRWIFFCDPEKKPAVTEVIDRL